MTEDKNKILEKEISECEIKQALGQMKNNKSTGSDGLTIEFYKNFFEIIKKDLTDTLNNVLSTGEMINSQKVAIITCIFEKGNKNDIGNWRPISLTNVDIDIDSNNRKLLEKGTNLKQEQITNICTHHHDMLVVRYEGNQKSCCNPFLSHQKVLRASLRVNTMYTLLEAEIIGLNLIRGKKLCPTCRKSVDTHFASAGVSPIKVKGLHKSEQSSFNNEFMEKANLFDNMMVLLTNKIAESTTTSKKYNLRHLPQQTGQ
ncbi:uncharacterized protein LOC136073071 [Hydra vulgaris]|uniref:uncharacterized protein LOC136073071 n=1 Tax=Hydra vulgaris TaxID=6087 RepID=UPI0032EA4A5E